MDVASDLDERAPSRLVLGLTLVLGVALVFGQAISFQFLTFDDPQYVTRNGHVLQGLRPDTFRWALFATTPSLWHPLTWVSHMVDVDLFGLNPAGHHIGNVLLHAASSVVLFLTLDRATSARYRSFLVAALFSVHPLRADSVAWVAERKDTLSTFLALVALLAYVYYAEAPSLRRYALVLLPYTLALLAKPMAVIVPVALLLLDAWPLARIRRDTLARCVLEKAPLFALGVVVGLITLRAHGHALAPLPPATRAANAVVAYARHFGHVFYPRHLAILYPFKVVTRGDVLGSSLLLVVLALVAAVAARTRPYVTFGLAWFFLLLFPVSGVIQSGVGAMADRFTYVPTIGLLIGFVWLTADLCDTWCVPRAARAGLASVLLLATAWAGFVEVSHYRDTTTVFTHAVDSTGDNWMAEEQLGNAALDDGDAATALRHFERESAIFPDDPVARDGAGQALEGLGRSAEAVVAYEAALRLTPGDVGVQNNLCVSLQSLERDDDARACWRRAIDLDGALPSLHVNLARLDEKHGRHADAVVEFERAIRLSPGNARAQNDLCVSLLASHRYDEAMTCLRRAIALAPSSPLPLLSLSRLYEETGRPDLAADASRAAEARRTRESPAP